MSVRLERDRMAFEDIIRGEAEPFGKSWSERVHLARLLMRYAPNWEKVSSRYLAVIRAAVPSRSRFPVDVQTIWDGKEFAYRRETKP